MKNLVFCCMILMVFIIACEKTTSPGIESKIFGTVLGPDGNPVENAKILVNFYIDSNYPIWNKKELNENSYLTIKDSLKSDPPPPPPVNYGIQQNCPNPFTSLTQIQFCLENACIGSLWIEDMFRNEIKILIENEFFNCDNEYSINWNGKNNDGNNIQNRIYKVLLETDYDTYKDTLFVFKDYNEFSYEDIAPLCMSDNSGELTIHSDELPLNYVGEQYDENGNHVGEFNVTPYVDIWAFHPNYDAVHVDSMLVESGKDVHVLLEFE